MAPKTRQLQIRVTASQKAEIKRLARRAGRNVSSFVLACVLPEEQVRFGEILRALREETGRRFALAELNDFLTGLGPREFGDAVAGARIEGLSPLVANYVAAMVEEAANRMAVDPPPWTAEVEPLEEPHFAAPLRKLRPHLLRAAPVAFKRRNIFVDSTIGDRV
jgi:hypothetical protein